MQAREDIRERLLQREGDGHTTDTHGGEDRGNRDAVVLEHDEHAHRVDDDVEDRVEQRRLRQLLLGALDVQRDEAVDRAGCDARDREDDDGEEDVGEEACQRLDDVDRVDDPVKADDEAERDGNAAQRVDEDVEPRVLVDVQVILDAAVDEFVEHDANRQRCCEDADRDEEHLHQMCPVNPGQPVVMQENNPLFVKSALDSANGLAV